MTTKHFASLMFLGLTLATSLSARQVGTVTRTNANGTQQTTTTTTNTLTPRRYVASEPVATNTPSHMRTGLGVATYGGGLNAPSISGWLEFNHKMSLQVTVGVKNSSPFNFGVGGLFRYNVIGGPDLGLHVGGGLLLGTAGGTATVTVGTATATVTTGSDFFLQIAVPALGIQVSPLPNLMFTFDASVAYLVTPSPFELTVGAVSGLLGGAVHLFF